MGKGRQISMDHGSHDWDKVNLVSKRDFSDDYKCKACGLKANRPAMASWLIIDARASNKKVDNCPGLVLKYWVGDEIIIVNCEATGKIFSNLKYATFHTIIDAPKPYKNDNSGVWVMGVGEPVKVLNHEFNFV